MSRRRQTWKTVQVASRLHQPREGHIRQSLCHWDACTRRAHSLLGCLCQALSLCSTFGALPGGWPMQWPSKRSCGPNVRVQTANGLIFLFLPAISPARLPDQDPAPASGPASPFDKMSANPTGNPGANMAAAVDVEVAKFRALQTEIQELRSSQ